VIHPIKIKAIKQLQIFYLAIVIKGIADAIFVDLRHFYCDELSQTGYAMYNAIMTGVLEYCNFHMHANFFNMHAKPLFLKLCIKVVE